MRIFSGLDSVELVWDEILRARNNAIRPVATFWNAPSQVGKYVPAMIDAKAITVVYSTGEFIQSNADDRRRSELEHQKAGKGPTRISATIGNQAAPHSVKHTR